MRLPAQLLPIALAWRCANAAYKPELCCEGHTAVLLLRRKLLRAIVLTTEHGDCPKMAAHHVLARTQLVGVVVLSNVLCADTWGTQG